MDIGKFLTDDFARPSSSRLLMAGTWAVSSATVVIATYMNTLTEWHFAAYLAAFSANYVANKIWTKAPTEAPDAAASAK